MSILCPSENLNTTQPYLESQVMSPGHPSMFKLREKVKQGPRLKCSKHTSFCYIHKTLLAIESGTVPGLFRDSFRPSCV